MVQAIIPRPIAWVLSDNDNNGYNLAPFSFFTGICSDPPLIMFSVGKKPSGKQKGLQKDTTINIRKHKEFVVHIASTHFLDPLNKSAATLDQCESELDLLDLETTSFEGFALPRIIGARIAMGCSLYRIDEIGHTPQSIIYGKIESMYVDDEIVYKDDKERLIIDSARLDPLSRLGGAAYAGIGPPMAAKRPQ